MSEVQPAHSKIGASSYYRWKACPGSVRLSVGIESHESEYAREGTAAHEIAADVLNCHYFTQGERATIPVHTTADMMTAVREYTEFVKGEVKKYFAEPDRGHVLIEHKFDLSSIHPGLYGTADCVIYAPRHKKLIVIDYKHGQGIAVEVENNLQLMYYGLGALVSTGLPCEKVELVIVQPRCDHEAGRIRKWEFSSVELLDFAATLAEDAKATEKPDAHLNPGPHCRFCPAAASKCPAIHEKAIALAQVEFKPTLSYDPEKLSQTLRFLPTMEAWIKATREFAYGEALHGRGPKDWKLVEKRKLRHWTASESEIVDYMKEATKRNVDEFYEKKLKSPAQMEKLLSKQLGVKLREMIETKSSGYTLVHESDKRPAVRPDPNTEFDMIEGDTNE